MTKRSLSHILKWRENCLGADSAFTCTQKAFLKIVKLFGFNGWRSLGYVMYDKLVQENLDIFSSVTLFSVDF